jgi:hypothetical protein
MMFDDDLRGMPLVARTIKLEALLRRDDLGPPIQLRLALASAFTCCRTPALYRTRIRCGQRSRGTSELSRL